jgi:hypothetical protein
VHTYLLKAFQLYQEHAKRCYGYEDLNMTNKNKQIIFLNRHINVAYAINPNVNMTLMIELNCEKKILKF